MIVQKQEAKIILDFIAGRIRKKLGCIILCTGESGKGKSYAGIRLLELWYRFWFDEDFPIHNVVQTLEEAMIKVKGFERIGEGIVIEELSALAGRRDSLSYINKQFNKFLDICRIKQAVIIGNTPHLSFVDKHFVMMCQLWLESLGVNFRKKVSVVKPLMIQTSQHRSEPYKHKLVDEEGDEIDFVHLSKPSQELSDTYDKMKSKGVDDMIEELVLKIHERKAKEGKKKLLAPREREAVELRERGLSAEEIVKKMGLSAPAIFYKYYNNAIRKGYEPKSYRK